MALQRPTIPLNGLRRLRLDERSRAGVVHRNVLVNGGDALGGPSKIARRMRLVMSSWNDRSTRFSRDELVGVKWR